MLRGVCDGVQHAVDGVRWSDKRFERRRRSAEQTEPFAQIHGQVVVNALNDQSAAHDVLGVDRHGRDRLHRSHENELAPDPERLEPDRGGCGRTGEFECHVETMRSQERQLIAEPRPRHAGDRGAEVPRSTRAIGIHVDGHDERCTEIMERRGIVGPAQGGSARREILNGRMPGEY